MKVRRREFFRALLPLVGLAAVGGFAISLLQGDGCGPVERGIRAGLGAWDMWETAMVAPFQAPLRDVPEGVVPVGGRRQTYTLARASVDAMGDRKREERSRLVYRRYCHHCHGTNGDNRIIVGESFGFRLPDLRGVGVQNLHDEQIFDQISHGSERMIGLASTLTAVDRILAVEYIRSLRGRPSKPAFPPRWVEPAEQPGGPR